MEHAVVKPVASLDEYSKHYDQLKLERRDGVLQVTLHDGKGKRMLFDGPAHFELETICDDIAADLENKAVIFTGCDGAFIDGIDFNFPPFPPGGVPGNAQEHGIRLIEGLLDIPMPTIAAVSGPATVHAEVAVLCDIVLASESAVFQDLPHYIQDVVPADGVHAVWPSLLGPNRGRYFLLTGEKIGAEEAKSLGFVQEVLPEDDLLPRAWELATRIATKPVQVNRYTSIAIRQDLKRRILADLALGLTLEVLSGTANWPSGVKR
jgi:enoyl-CoA hydratase/carnithine racemase